MRLVRDKSWARRGVTLLWGAKALNGLAEPTQIGSIRRFFELSRQWPEELPNGNGKSLIIAGMEGCLDVLKPEDAESWLEQELKEAILSFQTEYEGQAGLVLWIPSGRQRIRMNKAAEQYLWRCGHPFGEREIELGRILWAGAESDAGHVLDSEEKNQDPDGPAWIGLHHLRIS
jgi:hypothetical protein